MAFASSATWRMPSTLARSPTTTPAAAAPRSATLSARSGVRACSTTSWPWSSSARAAASPSPVVDPVIRTRAMRLIGGCEPLRLLGSSELEQCLDGTAFIHRSVPVGDLVQRKGQVEHLPGVDGALGDELDV